MFAYCYRIYTQIVALYRIKSYINNIHKKNISNDELYSNFESLKNIIFSCGSLYIKFFQWYISKLKSNVIDNSSYDVQLLTKFIKYFDDIFDDCPYHDIEHTQDIFEESMCGTTLEDYVDIDSFKQIASGSIGQVYYARRKADNLEIAIKIKHPSIEEDLKNQYELIKLIKFLQSFDYFKHKYNLYFNLDDFLFDINLQCDFNNEANNCKKFKENFKDSSEQIVFPNVIFQSNDMIISEYIEGESTDTLTHMQKFQTSLNFVCFFYQMLFIDNFIHGDLHCKNWKVRINKETNNIQLVIYDCGICFKNINAELTREFWFALAKYDIKSLNKVIRHFMINDDNGNGNGNGNGNMNISNMNNRENITNITEITNITDNNTKFDNEINKLFDNLLINNMNTTTVINTIINFFRSNNIIVNKFLLNFSILVCVIEEYLRENNIVDKDKKRDSKNSMFEIINDNQLDIIAFCDVKKCYPKIKDLLNSHMKTKFVEYKTNIIHNNISDFVDNKKMLFSSLSLSNLTFKTPT